jgi:hypothetical protein
MAAKRTIKERVQNNLFPELEEDTFGGSLNPSKTPRRSLNASQVGNYKGKEPTSREKRNKSLWASLYPTPKSVGEKSLKKY